MRHWLYSKKGLFLILLFMFFAYKSLAFFGSDEPADYQNSEKMVIISDNGLDFAAKTRANSVSEVIHENNLKLGDYDKLIPDPDSQIYSGTRIEIKRAVKIKIEADGKTIEVYTTAKKISDALAENNLTLGRLDKVAPDKNSLPAPDLKIIVTRINIEDITVNEDINFKTIVKEDPKLGWREKKITTPGELGIREVVYRVTYKNSKEISRVALSKKIVKDSVSQVETQGTYMKLKKADKGQATWYAYQGGMFAASTTIPRGNYAKVTSTASGKSIVVQINDYGPQGKGRIIDLDKVAFQKLAPIGAGVIGVKVEEILN